jgi:hypothetical protein
MEATQKLRRQGKMGGGMAQIQGFGKARTR